MNLYCSHCGEPAENDSLHEEAEARGTTYKEVAAEFRTKGCATLTCYGAKCSTPSTQTDATHGLTRQDAAGALYDLLGDDMDGAAAMLEDMGY